MSAADGNEDRRGRTIGLAFACALFIYCLPIRAGEGGCLMFGLDGGWGVGQGAYFEDFDYKGFHRDSDLNLNYGGHLHCRLSRRFGLRLGVNRQSGSLVWRNEYYGQPPTSGNEKYYYLLFELSGLYSFYRMKHGDFFMLLGTGLYRLSTASRLHELFSMGWGMRLFASPASDSAFTLFWTGHGLNFDDISYWRLQFGLEIKLLGRRKK